MVSVDTTVYKSKVREYAVISGKNIFQAVKEEARLIATKLANVTPPKSAGKGRKKVKDDIDRVYLSSDWFTKVFIFKSESLGEKVKNAVKSKNSAILDPIFQRSDKFRRIHIESFDSGILKRFRGKNGTVGKGVAPYSFPLSDQKKVKDLISKKQKNIALVKSAWGYCAKLLGGTVAAWMSKGNGNVIINENDKSVILINGVSYAANLDNRGGYTRFVLSNREKDLKTKIEIALKNVRF